MRLVVHDFITASIARAKPQLEQFIVGHLECPESVPLIFADRPTSIREIRGVSPGQRRPVAFSPSWTPASRPRQPSREVGAVPGRDLYAVVLARA